MNTAAKRRGALLEAAAVVSPQDLMDSSHGRLRATPTPRKKWRRETEWEAVFIIKASLGVTMY
jgi:hypothetical protein